MNLRRRPALIGLVLLLVLFGLLVLAVNPIHEFPIGDDWEYAHSVQRLLASGEFYRSPLVQATALFPAVWGALFSAALGFSFSALRLSTLPLAAGALLAFYGLLAELGFDAWRRLLGALTLMVAPLFVFYSHSFMTDVPFLFWLLLGLWCGARGFRLGRARWLLAGSACGALAFLTRQLGLALPAATAVVVLAHRPRADWPRWLAASLAVPLAAVLAFYGWQALAGQTTWADAAITNQGTLSFLLRPQLPGVAARRVVLLAVTLNLYMAPLWLALAPGWRQALRAARALNPWLRAAAALLGVFFVGAAVSFGLRGEWWPYFQESLTRAGLGPSLAFFAYPNDVRLPFLPLPFWAALTVIGAALSAALALNLLARVARALSTRTVLLRAPWRGLDPARSLVYLTALALLAALLGFPLIFARYFLPLLPAAILLLLEAARPLRPSRWLGAAALLAVAIFSVALMWDSWNWHTVRWANSERLIAGGVPLEKLDGGYEWNGWQLSDETYAYLRAHQRAPTNDPWQVILDPQYMVTFTLVPGYHVAEVWPFSSPFRPGGQDQLLLLARGAAP